MTFTFYFYLVDYWVSPKPDLTGLEGAKDSGSGTYFFTTCSSRFA